MVRMADGLVSDLGSIIGQVYEFFVIVFCWIRLIRRELWKKLVCLHYDLDDI